MKAKDIAVIVLVIGLGFMISYFTFDYLAKKQKPAKYRVVKVIKNNIEEPRGDIFTDTSINPAVQVIIGDKEKNESTQR